MTIMALLVRSMNWHVYFVMVFWQITLFLFFLFVGYVTTNSFVCSMFVRTHHHPKNLVRTQHHFTTMAAILSHQQRRAIGRLKFWWHWSCVHSCLICAVLVPPSLSSWRKLYDKRDSPSFLHITSLTQEAFDRLLYVVIPPGHSLCGAGEGVVAATGWDVGAVSVLSG